MDSNRPLYEVALLTKQCKLMRVNEKFEPRKGIHSPLTSQPSGITYAISEEKKTQNLRDLETIHVTNIRVYIDGQISHTSLMRWLPRDVSPKGTYTRRVLTITEPASSLQPGLVL